MEPADDAAAFEVDREAEQMLRDMGVPEDQISAHRQPKAAVNPVDAGPSVWAWHQAALQLFRDMRKRWNLVVLAEGVVLHQGLDLVALREVRTWLRIRPTPALWRQIKTMESAAMDVLNA